MVHLPEQDESAVRLLPYDVRATFVADGRRSLRIFELDSVTVVVWMRRPIVLGGNNGRGRCRGQEGGGRRRRRGGNGTWSCLDVSVAVHSA